MCMSDASRATRVIIIKTHNDEKIVKILRKWKK